MTASIVVITAGLSQPSSSRLLADRLAQSVVNALGGLGEHAEVTIVELRDHAADLANHFVTGFPAPRLAAILRKVTEADALIAVSPIFSASYSGLFKMFFDVLEPDALQGKPVLIGATGGSARHSLALEYALTRPNGPQPILKARKPSALNRVTAACIAAGSSMRREQYGSTRSRYRPPSSRPTGCPVTFPRISQSAMSMPLMA